ncbi:MAG TPA: GDSL-type esterase/lipase family protein, partial [Aggregatilineales bacterium]|nr:GDSL-type esterase/lipase family protein [Aggregatilineales bacterium]
MKAILARIAVACFGIILVLILLEVGLRIWFSTRGSEQERIMYVYDRATINAKPSQFIGVPFLNYALDPGQGDVNKLGYRGDAVASPKPQGVYRIVAIGASTTFGIGLAANETWPAQLQRLLRQQYDYHNVEVVNLGVPGYYSLNSVVNLATHGLALEPDLVINYDGVNDAVVRIYQDPSCYNSSTPLFGFGMDQGIWQFNTNELPPSTLYRFLAIHLGWMQDPSALTSRSVPTGLCPPEPNDGRFSDRRAKNPPVYFQRNLRSMAALASSVNARTLFTTFAWDSAAAHKDLAANQSLDGTR